MRDIRYLRKEKREEGSSCRMEKHALQDKLHRSRKGFTLAEMLITVAIIGILAAFGFVAVIRYQKSLKQTELDNTAREIFVAAQNHMTVARASGEWDTYVSDAESLKSSTTQLGNAMGAGASDTTGPSDYDGTLGTWNPDWADGTLAKDEKHDFRYVVTSTDETNDPGILSMILPYDSIDETLRGNRNIVIEYDAKTATVYGVWFCKQSDLKKALSSTASGTSIADTNAYQDKSRKSRSNRMNGTPMVGYYGGATANTKSADNDSVLQGVGITVENDDRLVLRIAVPADGFTDEDTHKPLYQIKATVKGKTSNKVSSTVIDSNGSSTSSEFDSAPNNVDLAGSTKKYYLYSYVLDSVTDGQKYHFANRFSDLIPGENIAITVTVTKTGSKSDKISETLNVNSLFGNATKVSSDNGKAVVNYGRHLQNLSSQVSNVNKTKEKTVVRSASLQRDIDWSQMHMSAVWDSDADTDAQPNHIKLRENWTVSQIDGTATQDKGQFFSLYNTHLTGFNGGGHKISNLKIDTCVVNSKNYGGLFGLIDLADSDLAENSSAMTISNVSLIDPQTVSGKADYLGFLIGETDNQTTIDHVTISAQKDGTTSGSLTLQAKTSTSDSPYSSGWWDNPAGGIAGASHGADIKITNSRINAVKYQIGNTDTQSSGTNSTSATVGGNSGGILGYHVGNGKIDLENCQIQIAENGSYTITEPYRTSGGMVGTVEPESDESGKSAQKPDQTTIENCQITGGSNATMKLNSALGYDNGGLIAYVEGAPLSVSNSSISGFAQVAIGGELGSDSNASPSLRASGGLIGEVILSDQVKISSASIQVEKLTVLSGEAAGGLIGRAGREQRYSAPGAVSSISIDNSNVKADSVLIHHMLPNPNGRGSFNDNNQSDASYSTVGGILGRAVSTTTTINNSSVIAGQSLSVISDRKSNVGGILGMQVGTGASLAISGCNVKVTDKLQSGAAAQTTSLKMSSLYAAGGILGTMEPWNGEGSSERPGSLTVTDCHVYGAGDDDTITGGSCAGGLIAYVWISGAMDVENSSSTAYLLDTDTAGSWASDYGTGGLIGCIRSTGSGSHIVSSYAGGRTSEGNYQDKTDASEKGRYNVISTSGSAVGGSAVGGFIGQLGIYNGDSVSLSIRDCFTTASSYSSKASRSGSFIGNRNQSTSSVTIQNSYATGLTNGTCFAGGTYASVSGNYYLSGINKNTFTDKNATAASKGQINTPFAVQTIVPETHVYDAALSGKTYPFHMPSGVSSFYGDWSESTKTFTGDFGILYYEIVQHGTGTNAGKDAYYHGYMGNTAISSGNTNVTEVSTKDTLSNTQDLNDHGLLKAENGGEYVTEDGYIVLVSDQYDTDQVGINLFSSTKSTISNAIKRGLLEPYDAVLEKLNIQGYHAYYINAKNSTLQDTIGWNKKVTFWTNSGQQDEQYSIDNWKSTLSWTVNPYFADYIVSSDSSLPYQIRSAHQLNLLFEIMNGSDNNNNVWWIFNNNSSGNNIEQTMDISYNNDLIAFTEPIMTGTSDISKDVKYNTSPKLNTLVVTYSGMMKSDNTYCMLDSLTQTLVDTIWYNSGYCLQNLVITNMNADSVVKNNHGTMSNLSVSDSKFTKSALISDQNTGTISNCTVRNVTIGSDGIVPTNSGTITGITLEAAMISGNGFVSSNSNQISTCKIVNAQIGKNGFAETNNGTISSCQVYADNSLYEAYQKQYPDQTGNYTPNENTVDTDLAESQKPKEGYNLMVCGLKPNAAINDANKNDSTAGFVQTNAGGTIQSSSFSGKIYGKTQAAGFFINATGTIDSCYANALVSAGSFASGFGISTSYNATITNSHSVGMTQNAKQGVGFLNNPTGSTLSGDYSAIWNNTTSNYSLFVSSDSQTSITGCGYLSSMDGIIDANPKDINGVTGYTHKELIQTTGFGNTGAATSAYGQYTSGTQYPYPMPSGMTAYGDWSNSSGYTIEFNANGGQGKMDPMESLQYILTYKLTKNAYTREGYTFVGWEDKVHSKIYSDEQEVRALAKKGTITLYAQWKEINNSTDFPYKHIDGDDNTGVVQEYTAQQDGWYKLEVWGAQGGSGLKGKYNSDEVNARDPNISAQGGKGGYSSGYYYLTKGQTVYVYIGGKGDMAELDDDHNPTVPQSGGWNGGGSSKGEKTSGGDVYLWGSGGGASHMALSKKNDLADFVNNQSDVLLVAGGGGGAGASGYAGGAGGGTSGSNGSGSNTRKGYGGTATTGGTGYARYYVQRDVLTEAESKYRDGAFGAGGGYQYDAGYLYKAARTNWKWTFSLTDPGWWITYKYHVAGQNGAGGGGGWYGGGMGYWAGSSAGGGSGYVTSDLINGKNVLLSQNKNSDESDIPKYIDGKDSTGNTGNGYGRITYLPNYQLSTDRDTTNLSVNDTVTITLTDSQNQAVKNATWKLTDASGNDISSQLVTGAEENIRTVTFSSTGTYTLTVTNPELSEITATIEINVGNTGNAKSSSFSDEDTDISGSSVQNTAGINAINSNSGSIDETGSSTNENTSDANSTGSTSSDASSSSTGQSTTTSSDSSSGEGTSETGG
ncbi:MAG: glycine-rich protein [Bilifractor sp.]